MSRHWKRWAAEKGPDEGKVFNLVRGLQEEIDDDPAPNQGRFFKALRPRTRRPGERLMRDHE